MIAVTSFAGCAVAVMGLGKSGLAAAQALKAGRAEVWAWDDQPARREAAAKAGIEPVDLTQKDLHGAAGLVLSPGIPHLFPAPHPVAARAREAGIDIVGEVELLARSQPEASYVGITGTNGKSTTTALIGHILGVTRHAVQVGGNLGTPALALDPLGRDGIYVLEMSSYQLELTRSLVFDVALLTNITPDHLDRHGGMEGYVAAKRRIFDRQDASCTAVVGMDDEPSRAIYAALAASAAPVLLPISAERRAPGGVYVLDGMLHDDIEGGDVRVADISTIPSLPGRHNWQNAAAAYAAARAMGVDRAPIVGCLRSFPGLAHRQEQIAVIDGVRYVNDSKATNADAAEKALVCYDNIYWIAGGRPKAGGIASLAPHFPRIRHAYLIGEAADEFARTLEGNAPYSKVGTLDRAVAAAREDARRERIAGAAVLLSPACASFDQFSDFEARGERFRALVEALPGEREAGMLAEDLE
jgi:UDP-N-acetylmuramoylalanine--D-glutamate ligase